MVPPYPDVCRSNTCHHVGGYATANRCGAWQCRDARSRVCQV